MHSCDSDGKQISSKAYAKLCFGTNDGRNKLPYPGSTDILTWRFQVAGLR